MSLRLPGNNMLEVNEQTLRTMVGRYLRSETTQDMRVTSVTVIRRKGGEYVFRFGVTTTVAPVQKPTEPKK